MDGSTTFGIIGRDLDGIGLSGLHEVPVASFTGSDSSNDNFITHESLGF